MAHLSDFTHRRQAKTERLLTNLVGTVLDTEVLARVYARATRYINIVLLRFKGEVAMLVFANLRTT